MTSAIALIASILITQAAGGIGVLFTGPGLEWYGHLAKPSWNPPSFVFAPVWTLLYALMATAAFLVWRRRDRFDVSGALWLYGIQLALNTTWSVIFFSLRSPAGAFAEILFLLSVIIVMAIAFWRIRPAATWLLVPYIAWVVFAAVLNFAIWRLN